MVPFCPEYDEYLEAKIERDDDDLCEIHARANSDQG